MSKHFEPAEIQRLKADLNLAAIVSRWTSLHRTGRTLRGPCPWCGGSKRADRFCLDPAQGFFHCFVCGEAGDAIDFLRRREGLTFSEALEVLGGRRNLAAGQRSDRPVIATALPSRAVGIRRARSLWRQTKPATGTEVETYLRGRGIRLGVPSTVRYHPSLPYWWFPDGSGSQFEVIHRGPAMVAAIANAERRITGVHCTWLAKDGHGKARIFAPSGEEQRPRKIRGTAAGGSIRLAPPAPVLLFGEGVETTLSVLQALAGPEGFRWKGKPVSAWAGISLTNLSGSSIGRGVPHSARPDCTVPSSEPDPDRPGMMPPDWAEEVILLGDGDSDPEITAARLECAARRYTRAGTSTMIAWARRGEDFNSMLQSGLPLAVEPEPAGAGRGVLSYAA